MKRVTKREFLKRLGLGSAALASAPLVADEFVEMKGALPPGGVGDPDNLWFAKNIFPLPHTIEDGPSCSLQNGKVICPAREIPIFHTTDVVVVGGGVAGFSAALAAARAGVKVALVERGGSLGGLFTNGMVLIMLSSSAKENGRWRLVTRGICEEFMHRASHLGAFVSQPVPKDFSRSHYQPTVDPECAKYLMDQMVQESKISLFYHCWGVDVIQEGPFVKGVVFESKQGKQAILAKQVVDATGDADVLFQAGGNYRQITHGIGHVVRLANLDRSPERKIPSQAKRKNMWPLRSNEANPSMWWGNFGTGPKGNGLDVREVTAAEIDFRKKWWEHISSMRQEPGWEHLFIASTCSQIGPRATRLIDAETIVTRHMLRASAPVTDSVGMCGVDGCHAAFQVPYRQLVPKGVENVVCAGRMLGAGDTIDTFRLICPCFVTGQAAGVAAALSILQNSTPRHVNITRLQQKLTEQKVCLS